jgi:acetyltransferase-like isoleucine patch superfamily enzyme
MNTVPNCAKRLFTALSVLFSTEPFFWAFWNVVVRATAKAKDQLLSRIFHAPGLHLGPGCLIKGAKHISLGCNIYVTRNLWLEAVVRYRGQCFNPIIEIGDGVGISDSVHITCIKRVVIGNHVLLGSRIYISDHNHGVYKGDQQSSPNEPPIERQLGGGGPVIIGKNAWVGDNVVIIGPVTIGEGAIIGANSIIREDIPPNAIVGGAPAKIIKRFNPDSRSWERV